MNAEELCNGHARKHLLHKRGSDTFLQEVTDTRAHDGHILLTHLVNHTRLNLACEIRNARNSTQVYKAFATITPATMLGYYRKVLNDPHRQ